MSSLQLFLDQFKDCPEHAALTVGDIRYHLRKAIEQEAKENVPPYLFMETYVANKYSYAAAAEELNMSTDKFMRHFYREAEFHGLRLHTELASTVRAKVCDYMRSKGLI